MPGARVARSTSSTPPWREAAHVATSGKRAFQKRPRGECAAWPRPGEEGPVCLVRTAGAASIPGLRRGAPEPPTPVASSTRRGPLSTERGRPPASTRIDQVSGTTPSAPRPSFPAANPVCTCGDQHDAGARSAPAARQVLGGGPRSRPLPHSSTIRPARLPSTTLETSSRVVHARDAARWVLDGVRARSQTVGIAVDLGGEGPKPLVGVPLEVRLGREGLP